MKYYIKQKVFSWTDTFTIWDGDGNVVYEAKGELFSWGHKLHVRDTGGSECAYIEQKLLTFLPKYDIYAAGKPCVRLIKEFTFFKPRYSLDGLPWTIEGDLWAHEYRIQNAGYEVARISKQWLTWGDCYEIYAPRDDDAFMALCVTLAIDCVMCEHNK